MCKSGLDQAFGNVLSLRAALRDNPSSNANGFESKSVLCHRDCFICSVCSCTLEENSKFDACGDRLYCTTHCNSEDLALIRALKSFKARCLALKTALEDEIAVNEFQEEITSFHCDSCSDPKYTQKVTGYRVECTEKDCPTRDAFRKSHEIRFKSCCDLGSTRVGGHVAAVSPEEFYRHFFYGVKHWNYCSMEEDIGAVLITLKPESSPHSKGYFR